MENRTGLIVDALVTPATGTAERDASLGMISRRPGDYPITVGEDKAYDTRDHVAELRHLRAMPHVAQVAPGLRRRNAIDAARVLLSASRPHLRSTYIGAPAPGRRA